MGSKKEIKDLACRDGFGEALVKLAMKNKNIVALTANLGESTRLNKFQEKFPERFFEMGVAEQNMMGVAAGLALSGKIPFVTSFGVFSPGRNWDQLRVSVCYNNANVKIIGSHCGLSVGEDGASHQALEDITITRCLPNLVVIAPSDYYETKKAVQAAVRHVGPVYIRFPRGASEVVNSEKVKFSIGKAQLLRQGNDVTLVACGPMVATALNVAKILKQIGVESDVINCSTIKPLDQEAIICSAKKTKIVFTIEDHQIIGGLGSAVAECLSVNLPTKIHCFGVADSFGESGTANDLYLKFGLDSTTIASAIEGLI